MRFLKHCIRLLIVMILLPWYMIAGGKSSSLSVSVNNPSPVARPSEVIELPLSTVSAALGTLDSLHPPVVVGPDGAVLRSQVADGVFLFQADFDARETKSFTIRTQRPGDATFPQVVDGRFVLPREDYAWENDRIAFRMYGPALAAEVNNGIDVWTKRVRYPIVAKWYKESENAPPGKDTYHQDRGEGADFFEVGRSLGAGGSGLWEGGALHQPGVFRSQRTITNGPVRVKFELTYRWGMGTDSLIERKTIALDAGQNLNRVEVRFEGRHAGDSLMLACGLVKRPATTISRDPHHRFIGLWGLTNADSVNGSLGTGIVLAGEPYREFTEDPSQYLILSPVRIGSPFVYYAGAGWTRNGNFATEDDWTKYLETTAERVREPLVVHVARP